MSTLATLTIRRLISIQKQALLVLPTAVCHSASTSSASAGAFSGFRQPFLFRIRPLATTRIMSSSTHQMDENEHVRRQKQELRKKIRSYMKEVTEQDVEEQSAMVWKQVFELPSYKSAKSVGMFLSMPKGEINTDLIIQDCVQKMKNIYVPEVGKNFELCDMELRKVILDANSIPSDGMFHKTWPKNKWEIPEPPDDMPNITAQPGDIDLLVMPGLGFDRSRNRLGQGKGYYDRFIAKMTKDGHPLHIVAVALRPQLVEETIPTASYDRRMDMIVLPDEIIDDKTQN